MTGRCCCRCGRTFGLDCSRGAPVELHRYPSSKGREIVRQGALCTDCLTGKPRARDPVAYLLEELR